MRKYILPLIVLLAAVVSCKRVQVQPRPTLPLVHSIAADTAGIGRLAAQAGRSSGSIAIIGEPENAILLARRFQRTDRVDNVDGTPVRDSLPDFAGETFDVLMDAMNAPYVRFWTSAEAQPEDRRSAVLDSLREVAVLSAVCAWDSLSWRSTADAEPMLRKERAKVLIYTSSLQAQWGLFDVDTLQQMTGGSCYVLSPVKTLLSDAYASGARSLAVWTSRDVRTSGAWQAVFEDMDFPDAYLSVITPEVPCHRPGTGCPPDRQFLCRHQSAAVGTQPHPGERHRRGRGLPRHALSGFPHPGAIGLHHRRHLPPAAGKASFHPPHRPSFRPLL